MAHAEGQMHKETRTAKGARLSGPTRLSARHTRESGKAASAGDKRRLQSEMKPRSRTNAERPACPEPSLAPLFGFPNIISHANGQLWPHAIVKASGAHFEKDYRNAEPQFAAYCVAAHSRLQRRKIPRRMLDSRLRKHFPISKSSASTMDRPTHQIQCSTNTPRRTRALR